MIAGLRYVVDGRGMGSFANHSYGENARLSSRFGVYPYFGHFGCIGLDMHVVVVATKTIHPNEEMFIRYSRHSCTRLGIDYIQKITSSKDAAFEVISFGHSLFS